MAGSNGHSEIPAVQGIVGYKKPPVEHQFKPGQSGNPGGSRTAGAYIQEHMNFLCGAMEKGELTVDQLHEIAIGDPNGNRRMAAQTIMGGTIYAWTKSGLRIGAPDFDRVMDRTLGKPNGSDRIQVDGTIRVEYVHVDRIMR